MVIVIFSILKLNLIQIMRFLTGKGVFKWQKKD